MNRVSFASGIVFRVIALSLSADSSQSAESENSPKNISNPFGAAIFDSSSSIFVCNGAVHSSVFVFTSCRCLCSAIAIIPYYSKRNASRYGLQTFFHTDDLSKEDEPPITEQQIGIGIYGIEKFILHPYCFRNKVSKPHRKHFGLVVLKDHGIKETVDRLVTSTNIDVPAKRICRIVGLHTDDGRLTLKETKMSLMSSDDCLWRLCVPRIGCNGRDSNVRSGQELCLTTIDHRIPKLRIYEGSVIMCNNEGLGLIVSTGRIRHPEVPAVAASIKQFVDNMPTSFDSRRNCGWSKTPRTSLEIYSTFFTLIQLLISDTFSSSYHELSIYRFGVEQTGKNPTIIRKQ